MTAEKYVNQIIRKVKCSKGKRNEIKKQILSDIEGAMAEGESLESVMERMGKADSIAEEFNQNFSEDERKAYKKSCRIRVISIIILMIALLAAGGYWMLPKISEISTEGTVNQASVEEQTRKVIELFDAEDYDSLKSCSVEQMKDVLNKEVMDAAKSQIGDNWGNQLSFGKFYMQEIEQQGLKFIVVQVNVSYENVSVTYTITYDAEMKLAGLYMK